MDLKVGFSVERIVAGSASLLSVPAFNRMQGMLPFVKNCLKVLNGHGIVFVKERNPGIKLSFLFRSGLYAVET